MMPNGPSSNKISPFETQRVDQIENFQEAEKLVNTRDMKELPDPNQLIRNSNDYFNEVSYLVDLNHLYKRIETCYHDDN
eukprot:403375056